MKQTIRITQKNIDDGVRDNSVACPIALGVRSYCELSVLVDVDAFLVAKDNYYLQLPLPPAVATFVNRFDSLQAVKPFSFEYDFEEAIAAAMAAREGKGQHRNDTDRGK